ncbi:MAG: nitroreductase family protein [Solobacterium sp.]|nr:nitroreductase family protein [Solobacterium sp.]
MKNTVFELGASRRSVRKYTDEHIPDEVLDEIMKAALTAPCSFGHRPVEFVVVRDQEMIRKVASCKRRGGTQIVGADTVIVVMVNLERGEFWIEDGAIASAYILLAAEEYGLGTCWVHIRNREGKEKTADEEIRELLGVPEGYAVLNLIALGGKGEQKPGYTEADYDFGKIHWEHY